MWLLGKVMLVKVFSSIRNIGSSMVVRVMLKLGRFWVLGLWVICLISFVDGVLGM